MINNNYLIKFSSVTWPNEYQINIILSIRNYVNKVNLVAWLIITLDYGIPSILHYFVVFFIDCNGANGSTEDEKKILSTILNDNFTCSICLKIMKKVYKDNVYLFYKIILFLVF